jgi:hypothetical protein
MPRARWTATRPRQWTATRDKCNCGGYGFPHRKGSGMCDHSARSDYYRAIRDGVPPLEALQYLSVHVLERVAPLPDHPPQQQQRAA